MNFLGIIRVLELFLYTKVFSNYFIQFSHYPGLRTILLGSSGFGLKKYRALP
jgi:hypothetical protein